MCPMIWALRPLAQISQLETQTFNVFDQRKQELLQTGLLFPLNVRSKEADSKSFSPLFHSRVLMAPWRASS